MSEFTTLKITRSKAKKMLMDKLMSELVDAELEELMDALLAPRLYNCQIVTDHYELNDDNVLD